MKYKIPFCKHICSRTLVGCLPECPLLGRIRHGILFQVFATHLVDVRGVFVEVLATQFINVNALQLQRFVANGVFVEVFVNSGNSDRSNSGNSGR